MAHFVCVGVNDQLFAAYALQKLSHLRLVGGILVAPGRFERGQVVGCLSNLVPHLQLLSLCVPQSLVYLLNCGVTSGNVLSETLDALV